MLHPTEGTLLYLRTDFYFLAIFNLLGHKIFSYLYVVHNCISCAIASAINLFNIKKLNDSRKHLRDFFHGYPCTIVFQPFCCPEICCLEIDQPPLKSGGPSLVTFFCFLQNAI